MEVEGPPNENVSNANALRESTEHLQTSNFNELNKVKRKGAFSSTSCYVTNVIESHSENAKRSCSKEHGSDFLESTEKKNREVSRNSHLHKLGDRIYIKSHR